MSLFFFQSCFYFCLRCWWLVYSCKLITTPCTIPCRPTIWILAKVFNLFFPSGSNSLYERFFNFLYLWTQFTQQIDLSMSSNSDTLLGYQCPIRPTTFRWGYFSYKSCYTRYSNWISAKSQASWVLSQSICYSVLVSFFTLTMECLSEFIWSWLGSNFPWIHSSNVLPLCREKQHVYLYNERLNPRPCAQLWLTHLVLVKCIPFPQTIAGTVSGLMWELHKLPAEQRRRFKIH